MNIRDFFIFIVLLKRKIVVLLGRQSLLLVRELLKSPDHAETGVPRLDDVIDISHLCRLIRITEQIVVLVFLLFGEFRFLLRDPQLPSTLFRKGSSLLRRLPSLRCWLMARHSQVASQLLAAHNVVGPSVDLRSVTVTFGTVASP